jgi:hypothetical protein
MQQDNRFNSEDEVAVLFKRLFETTDGQDVLSVLRTLYQKPALVPNAAVDGTALALLSFTRMGEQNVINKIDALINRQTGRFDK